MVCILKFENVYKQSKISVNNNIQIQYCISEGKYINCNSIILKKQNHSAISNSFTDFINSSCNLFSLFSLFSAVSVLFFSVSILSVDALLFSESILLSSKIISPISGLLSGSCCQHSIKIDYYIV